MLKHCYKLQNSSKLLCIVFVALCCCNSIGNWIGATRGCLDEIGVQYVVIVDHSIKWVLQIPSQLLWRTTLVHIAYIGFKLGINLQLELVLAQVAKDGCLKVIVLFYLFDWTKMKDFTCWNLVPSFKTILNCCALCLLHFVAVIALVIE